MTHWNTIFHLLLVFTSNAIIIIQACSSSPRRVCQTHSEGNSSSYRDMLPSEFPPLAFGPNDGAEEAINEKINRARTTQNILAQLDTLGSIASLAGLSTSAPTALWSVLKPVLVEMESIVDLQYQKLSLKIDKTVTSAHIQLTQADILVLKMSTERMLDTTLNEDLRKREVVPARNICLKILALFKNQNYVFWKDPVYSSGHILSFTYVMTSVGAVACKLDPTLKLHFQSEYLALKNLLVDYKNLVKPLRSKVLSQHNHETMFDAYRRTPEFKASSNYEYGTREMSVCDYLYYYKCPDFAKRPKESPRENETRCAKGIYDSYLEYYYGSDTSTCSRTESRRGNTICVSRSHRKHPNYHVAGKPAKYSTIVFDPVGNNYACGDWNLCLKDYREVIEAQVENTFNEAIQLVESRIV